MQGFGRTESFSRFHQDHRYRAMIEPIRTDDGCAWVAVSVGVEFLRSRSIVVLVANEVAAWRGVLTSSLDAGTTPRSATSDKSQLLACGARRPRTIALCSYRYTRGVGRRRQ
jgi:hypothetical protein